MNKYTLSFKDNQLELKYLTHRIKTIQFPTLTYLTAGGSILLIANSIANLISSQYTEALTKGVVMLYIVIQYFLLKKYEQFRKYCNMALMLTNFASLVFEIEIPTGYGFYDGYLLGSNQMLVHTILMFACNLELGVLSNLVLTVVRIVLATQNYTVLTVQQYFYSLIMSGSFIVIQFQLEKQFRLSYLLSLRDNTWEVLIPLLLRKPFFIFSFNQHGNEYQSLLQHQEEFFDSDKPLSTFLYSSKVKRKSLWSYMEKQTKVKLSMREGPCLFHNSIDVEYQLRKLKVSVIACKFERIVYAITIESEDPILKEQKNLFLESLQQYKTTMNRQIVSINKVLGVFLQETYHPLLRNLRITLIQIYHLQSNTNKLQLVKMKKLLQKCIMIFETPTISIKVNCCENLKFVTIKSTLIIFLFEIFKTLEPNQQLYIIINQTNTVTIFMYGLKCLPVSSLFDRARQIIIEHIIQKSQCILVNILQIIPLSQ